jgi:peroxiredoxin
VAISVDPSEISRDHGRRQGYTFTLLSDPSGKVIRLYDLLHEKAGPGGQDISRPAEFLIDAGRTVRWVNLAESITARARPEQALAVIDSLALPESGKSEAN